MSSMCQRTEAAAVAASRLFHCNTLLPWKRSGLAMATEKNGHEEKNNQIKRAEKKGPFKSVCGKLEGSGGNRVKMRVSANQRVQHVQ